MATFTDWTDPRANSYLNAAEASTLLEGRLYTAKWDSAGSTPDAMGWSASAVASTGATSVDVSGGSGTWVAGDTVQIGGYGGQVLTVQTWVDPTLTFTAQLTSDVSIGQSVERTNPNEREAALIYATRHLDSIMNWAGSKRFVNTGYQRWPRIGVVDPDGQNITDSAHPEDLKRLTAEAALELLQSDESQVDLHLKQALKTATLPGPLRVTFDTESGKNSASNNLISPRLLGNYWWLGRLNSQNDRVGGRVVHLLRG